VSADGVVLTILMPVFNERGTVERAIAETLDACSVLGAIELVVVDDGSTDGTRELLAERNWPDEVLVLHHDRNRGKGAALQTGLAQARGRYATVMDADLEYDPHDLVRLVAPITNGIAEVVYGVRGFQSHSAYNFWYVVGNKGVTLAANVLFNSWVGDIMTCLKVMPTELFRSLRLRERGFAIEPEITARLLKQGVRIYEVPIEYHARSREAGKKLTALDGVRVIATLLRCRIA
jgi:glycosyltransferase involved in cell wall biosynthesis